jgi:hypothetical protein
MSLTINRTKNDARSNIINPSPTLLFSSFILVTVFFIIGSHISKVMFVIYKTILS